MYIESSPGSSGFPQQHHGDWRHHRGSGGPGSGMMIQGDSGSNAASGVEIMGPPSNSPMGPPGGQSAPAAPPAMVLAPHATADAQHANLAIGVGIALVLGLGFVIYKATRD